MEQEAQAYGLGGVARYSAAYPTPYLTRQDISFMDALKEVYGDDAQRVIDEAIARQASFGTVLQDEHNPELNEYSRRYALPDYSKGVGDPIPTYHLTHFAKGPGGLARHSDDRRWRNDHPPELEQAVDAPIDNPEDEPGAVYKRDLDESPLWFAPGFSGGSHLLEPSDIRRWNMSGFYNHSQDIYDEEWPPDSKIPFPHVGVLIPSDLPDINRRGLGTLVHELTHALQDRQYEDRMFSTVASRSDPTMSGVPFHKGIGRFLESPSSKDVRQDDISYLNYLFDSSELPAWLSGSKAEFKIDTGETLGANFDEDALQRFIEYLEGQPDWKDSTHILAEFFKSDYPISSQEAPMGTYLRGGTFTIKDLMTELLRQVASVESDTAVG